MLCIVTLFIMIDLQFQSILEVDFPVCDHPAIIIYSGGRETERQSATNSSMKAVPAHMTVSAPPQYILPYRRLQEQLRR